MSRQRTTEVLRGANEMEMEFTAQRPELVPRGRDTTFGLQALATTGELRVFCVLQGTGAGQTMLRDQE